MDAMLGTVGEKESGDAAFSKWLSERHQSEAQILKQARLLREERGQEDRRQRDKDKKGNKGDKGGWHPPSKGE